MRIRRADIVADIKSFNFIFILYEFIPFAKYERYDFFKLHYIFLKI